MVLLLVYGLGQSFPDKRAVLDLRQGRAALGDGNYVLARKSYNTVLTLVPNSAVARQGLACAFYLEGMRSAAALELTKGLEVGVFAERLGDCSHGLNLDDVFFAAKLGLSDAFAAPKVAAARRFEEVLLEEPTGTTGEEPGRMLLGACLAHRAGLLGATWYYAGNALETGAIDASDRARFFACVGPQERRRSGCAPRQTIRACVMTPAAHAAYFRDSRLTSASSRHGVDR